MKIREGEERVYRKDDKVRKENVERRQKLPVVGLAGMTWDGSDGDGEDDVKMAMVVAVEAGEDGVES